MEDWHLIIEALVLNKVEEYITEQVKKKYGDNVNIRFNNKKSNKPNNKANKKSKTFDRTQYRIECEKNWRK